MGYVDEEILKLKGQAAKEQEQAFSKESIEKELEESIFDGLVHLYQQPVTFRERLIPELQLQIMMPEAFALLDEEMKRLIYPLGNAPSHVFGSGEINFNLALSATGNQIPNEGMPRFLPMAQKMIETMGPKTTMIGSGMVEKEGRNFAVLEFVSRAIDMNVYNVMFYFSMADQLMIGTINFPAKYQKRMIKIAKEMIDSLTMLEIAE